jgi:hypothetical protein
MKDSNGIKVYNNIFAFNAIIETYFLKYRFDFKSTIFF